ncbi:MAG TPA: hypothetical protein VM346_03810 [Sphingomicrobium sp.]|jgi:hypothetical protein|nr:hypothetical protein [Sphingomicrobium sp.]HXH52402.1 hypothetical protein [Sphingomicrobium sp.]
MTRTTLLALAAAAALAGCNNEGHTIITEPGGPDPMADALANAGPVELPPAIQASRVYRCRDNSLIYVDWLSNDTARLKNERNEIGTTVTKGEDGTYTAEGQRLTGSAGDQSITVNGQSCRR